MDLFEAIKKRQSIRKYKPDPVSDKDLNTILEAARLAPSWHNYQCWRFVVVKDPEVKTDTVKLKMDVNYVNAEETLKVISDVLNQPEDIVSELKKFIKF